MCLYLRLAGFCVLWVVALEVCGLDVCFVDFGLG